MPSEAHSVRPNPHRRAHSEPLSLRYTSSAPRSSLTNHPKHASLTLGTVFEDETAEYPEQEESPLTRREALRSWFMSRAQDTIEISGLSWSLRENRSRINSDDNEATASLLTSPEAENLLRLLGVDTAPEASVAEQSSMASEVATSGSPQTYTSRPRHHRRNSILDISPALSAEARRESLTGIIDFAERILLGDLAKMEATWEVLTRLERVTFEEQQRLRLWLSPPQQQHDQTRQRFGPGVAKIRARLEALAHSEASLQSDLSVIEQTMGDLLDLQKHKEPEEEWPDQKAGVAVSSDPTKTMGPVRRRPKRVRTA